MNTPYIHYQGWSGCIVRAPSAERGTALVFDPSPDGELDATEATILLTHGHPEHVEGALAHVRREGRAPVAVVASEHVCRYLERRSANTRDRFLHAAAGSRLEVNGWHVRVFAWEHMPLLPPGRAAAARYLMQLIKHPRGLARIALGSATGLRHGPMLGFSVRAAGARGAIVYYGEGVHRRLSRETLDRALGRDPIDAFVFGAEPEDASALPELLTGLRVGKLLAFEPHRSWRAAFELPQLDTAELAENLRTRGLDAAALSAGDTVELSCD